MFEMGLIRSVLVCGVVSMVLLITLTTASIVKNQPAKILKYYSNLNPDGSYKYEFETSNGINVNQRGQFDKTLQVAGSFKYISPNGTPILLTYTADENGFHPQGNHLPTPPPIPPQIVRALKWIKEQKKKKQKPNTSNDIKEEFFNHVV